MSTRKVLTLVSMVAMLFSRLRSAPIRHPIPWTILPGAGESLDSGLGDLSPFYTAAEFQRGYRLPASRSTAAWAICLPPIRRRNSSGLPSCRTEAGQRPGRSAAELHGSRIPDKDGALSRDRRVTGQRSGSLPASYTAAEFQKQVIVATR